MPLEIIHCAPGAHIGEQITLSFLEQHLNDGVVLTNYYHPDGQGTLEIDLVLVNFQGIWLIEVKHWWGEIKADDIYWLHNRQKHRSPITSIDRKCKIVNSYLKSLKFKNINIVGFVVLSKGTQALSISDSRSNRVFGLNQDLIHALTSRDFIYWPHNPTIKGEQIRQITQNLVSRHIDPEQKIVGNYRIVAELTPGENFSVYEGQHLQIDNRRARLKKYHIQNIQNRKHLDKNVKRFKRDMEALSQLGLHPNIVQAYDFFPDADSDDVYWLILEYVEGETLQDILDNGVPLPFSTQVSYLLGIASALDHCHKAGVAHRNLSPQAIYFTEDGIVKVSDFDFARVPMSGYTISMTNQPLVINKYIALEQQTDPRSADHRADIFSLGVIWYDMAISPSPAETTFINKIEQSDLPIEAQALMKQMLATRPIDRPQRMSEIIEWFELFKG